MNTFFQTHRKKISLVANLLFWLATCFTFIRFSMLRPLCTTHLYKEFVCVSLIAAIVLVTRMLTIPKLFSNGRYGWFWLVSAIMLFTATLIEILLVTPEIQDKVYFTHRNNFYLPHLFLMVLFRDSCFFAWFLVFRLYTLQKDAFRAKQRASVLEHQTVQFSTRPHHPSPLYPRQGCHRHGTAFPLQRTDPRPPLGLRWLPQNGFP